MSFVELNEKHQEVALLLAQGMKQQEIADKVGYTRVYICRLANKPVMKEALRDLRISVNLTAIDKLRSSVKSAVDVITRILKDPESTPGMQLKAADMILRYANLDYQQYADQLSETADGATEEVREILTRLASKHQVQIPGYPGEEE